MEKINWTAGNGSKIEFSVWTDYTINEQGYRRDGGHMIVEISATLDGEDVRGDLRSVNHPVAVAKFGVIGITQDNLDRINTAVAAAQSIADAHNAELARHEATLDAATAETNRITKAMAYGEPVE